VVLRVLLFPGEVGNARHLGAVSQEDSVASPMAVLPPVELDEIGRRLLELADEDGDREHRLGYGEHVLGLAGTFRREDDLEASRLGRRRA
jgi:hypothetical protein